MIGLMYWWTGKLKQVREHDDDSDEHRTLVLKAATSVLRDSMLENGWFCGLSEEQMLNRIVVKGNNVVVLNIAFWHPSDLSRIVNVGGVYVQD